MYFNFCVFTYYTELTNSVLVVARVIRLFLTLIIDGMSCPQYPLCNKLSGEGWNENSLCLNHIKIVKSHSHNWIKV
jgi:hypothetical protein